MKSKNPNSYMFHTPAIDLAYLQAEAMGLPIIVKETAGEKELELEDLEEVLLEAKEKYKIDGVVTAVDLTQVMLDGPVVIELETEVGESHSIAVPSMGFGLCAAAQKIAGVYDIAISTLKGLAVFVISWNTILS